MNIACWNVRGINKSSHQKELMQFIFSNNISFMSCVETRVKSINASSISNKICRSWSWVFNYDHHHNGRIWVGWDPNVWIVNVISKTSQHVTCSVTFLEKQVHFFVSFVYALNKPYQREPLWSDLLSLSHTITSPWCILGDLIVWSILMKLVGDGSTGLPICNALKNF